MDVWIYTLLVYGITNIIVRGVIFDKLKERLENLSLEVSNKYIKYISMKMMQLLNCPMCTGFHVGWFVGLFFGPFAAWNLVFNGAFYSGTTWIINAIVQYLGQGTDPERNHNHFVHSDSSIQIINKSNEENKRKQLNG